MHIAFELLCYYLLMSFMAGVVMGFSASDQAKTTDIVLAALIWPYTAYRFYQHLKNY